MESVESPPAGRTVTLQKQDSYSSAVYGNLDPGIAASNVIVHQPHH